MTDDAERRAEIEAARASDDARPVDGEPAGADVGSGVDDGAERPAGRGPASLAPTRPWSRGGVAAAEGEAHRPSPSPPARGVGPVRPWLRNGTAAANGTPAVTDSGRAAPRPSPTGLQPVRAWNGRPRERRAADDAGLTPSNPSVVLEGLAAEAAEAELAAREVEVDQPGAGTEIAGTPDIATAGSSVSEVAGGVGATDVAEDAASTAGVVEGVADVATDRGRTRRHRRTRRRGEGAATPRHAAEASPAPRPSTPDEPESRESEVAQSEVAQSETAQPEIGSSDLGRFDIGQNEIEQFGQPEVALSDNKQSEFVLSDIGQPEKGQPEVGLPDTGLSVNGSSEIGSRAGASDEATSDAERPRGHRALRWFLARAPEPAPVDAADAVDAAGAVGAAETGVEAIQADPSEATAGVEEGPGVGAQVSSAAQPAIEPESTAQVPTTVDAPTSDEDEATAPAEPSTSRFARLFGRRSRDEDDGEEYEQFTLPEPDESFARPWLRPPDEPAPTRDWAWPRRAPAPASTPQGEGAGGPTRDAERATSERAGDAPAPGIAGVAASAAAEPASAGAESGSAGPSSDAAAPAADLAVPSSDAGVPVSDASISAASAASTDAPKASPRPGAKPRPATPGGEHRPVPGSGKAPSAHPRPGHRSATGPETAAPPARPAPGPGPGPRREKAPRLDKAPRLGIAGASAPTPESTLRPDYRPPDLSKFLEAAEPKSDDDQTDNEPEQTKGRGGSRGRRFVVRTLIVVVIAAVAALVLRAFVVQPYYIPSESMEPTLRGCSGCTDDHVLVDKLTYRAHNARVGDIVVFHRPKNAHTSEKVLIKRVIALPGDTIQLRDGHVFVNGNLLDEPYVNQNCGSRPTLPLNGTSTWRVPGNDLFVMGDNRCNSYDSRAFGPIPESSVIGRAFMIIWPLNRITVLGH